MKNKTTAGLLALLLGAFGAHYFYLNRPVYGILCLLFFWTYIPTLWSTIWGILCLTMSDEEFNNKYNCDAKIKK